MKPELNDVINENFQTKGALYTSTSNSTNTNMKELTQYDNNNIDKLPHYDNNHVDYNSYTLHHLKKTNETLQAKNA